MKIFCVGFQKTGTTSLGAALEILGYRTCGYHPFRDLSKHTDAERLPELIKERALDLLADHDAFKDTPWPLLYRECDVEYPGSKFIHVVRDEERWIESVVKDFGSHTNAIHAWIYGADAAAPQGREAVYLARYRRHNLEVCDYFKDRPNDFISLNMSEGEVNWENICNFLGHEVVDQAWPKLNKRASKRRRVFTERWKNRLLHLFKKS